MYKIFFLPSAYKNIDVYVSRYRDYFEDIYSDTGILEEKKIIENYILESEERYFQIFDTISNKLSQKFPSYPKNRVILHWRTKILLVSFVQEDDLRIVTEVDIR